MSNGTRAVMTSRERLLAAMRREEVDRIPLAPRMEMYIVPRFYQSGSLWACKKFKRDVFDCDPTCAFGLPIINPFSDCTFVLPYLTEVDMTIHREDQGKLMKVTRTFETPVGPLAETVLIPKPGVTEYGAAPNPHRVEYLIKSTEDIERVRYLFPDPTKLNLAEYHHAVEEMGEEGLVLLNIPGPMDYLAGETYPMVSMMVDYYENPGRFDGILAMFGDYVLSLTRTALEQGVRHFFLGYFYTSLSSGWSPAILREKFLPILQQQVAMIHAAGGLVDYYDDGKLMGSLDLFVEAGVDVVETCAPPPVGDFDLREAKRRWGDRVTFKGLVDMINVVARGTARDIEAHLREIVESNGGRRGMILGTVDNLRPETSEENVAAYFNLANQYR